MTRKTWRRLWMGLMTVMRIAPRGFFIPYRYASQIADTPPDSYRGVHKRYVEAEPAFLDLLSHMDSLAGAFDKIGDMPPPAPRWEQDWFPGLDAAGAYAMVRKHAPRRIIEIGCGHSTRFFARAVSDGGLTTRITAIDPAPRADLAGVGVHLVRSTIQNAGLEHFDDLESGDVVSIDSSHILMPGTDVDILLNRVLPRLPNGTLVHIHDMFLPDDYPAPWSWRGYNEQLGVALLISGGEYRPLWASYYVRSRMQRAID
ncbi:MAG: class I SAM-dependent methyltransferase, partial [Alphaproteobacteria bacterium]|nr:class I SAM-dependent methyltransferase [Alphaproteobacteria bacterium]